ncbi:MAG: glycerophosphodiester phosphodiesterase family protein [Ignavibacteriaceae bacterium]
MINKIKLIQIWIKEYFSTCRPINKKYVEKNQLFLVTGHRGSPTKEIENTIQSFETALNDGANSLEIDLCITKDHEVVIWHDWNPNAPKAILRESGLEPWVAYKPHPPNLASPYRKKISELTRQEFMENYKYKKRSGNHNVENAEIPTLDDFLKWSKDKKQLKFVFFNIKTPPEESGLALIFMQQLSDLLAKYEITYNSVIETFHPEVLNIMKKDFPEFNYSLDEEPDFGFILNPEKFSSIKVARKYNNKYAVAFRPRKVTIANWTTYRRIVRFDVKLRYKYNKENPDSKIVYLIGGTVNKKQEFECLVKLGIGGIQTDFPHLLKEVALRNGKRIN